MVQVKLDGHLCRLKQPFDLRFLHDYGRVFRVMDEQDSGNLCFGVEGEAGRLFIKLAGARTLRAVDQPQDAVARLRAAEPLYRALAHPNLVTLREGRPAGEGYALFFDWFDGFCPGKQYGSAARFHSLPLEQKLSVFAQVLDFHLFAASRGYVAIDFYDSTVLVEAASGRVKLCDIDLYQLGPVVNTMGRMWGSARFMSPEECTLGAAVDEVTNVFTMGAAAFALLGGELDRSEKRWIAGPAAYRVALRAVSPSREDRYPSLAALAGAWRLAVQADRAQAGVTKI